MKKVAILAAHRSAIGSFGGSLKDIPLADLGAQVTRYALEKTNIASKEIDEVIFGNVLSSGQGQNIARQIAIKAGLPETTPAYAVNKVCGSGLKAILLAAQSILLGDNDLVIAGGIESMSQAPYLSKTSRFGGKLGHLELEDSILRDGLTDAFDGQHMGMTAENIAKRYQLTRHEQDAFALASQEKAAAAIEKGLFAAEIAPVEVTINRKSITFDTDEYPRQTSLEALAKLRPAFDPQRTVTAGNASGINDGCAVLILASEEKAKELGITPLAVIDSYATSGLDPAYMGLGPIEASKKAVEKAGLSLEDIDLFELNEAFAAQSIPVIQELGIDPKKVNTRGGAIALGHPIGASGARVLVTLLHALQQENKTRGLCSLCIGGGQGISLIVSR